MTTKQLSWLWTALVTPFKEWDWIDNEIDYVALDRLLNMQIDAEVDWVLLLWTTWERPTLTEQEEIELIKFSINILKWKTKIMVNAGTYSTLDNIKTIKYLNNIEDIDWYLLVNPYYNKPTQTGLKKHFIISAKQTDRAVILYNIKWRTGVNLETNTLLDIISECPNVVWVKEASWDLNQIKDVIDRTPENFLVFSWDDSLTYDLIKFWWNWVISVASNSIPTEMKEFVDLCLINDTKAKEINEKHSEFFDKIFIQTNPLPTKTLLASKWIIKEEFRLPMCRMDEKEKKEFLDFIKENKY